MITDTPTIHQVVIKNDSGKGFKLAETISYNERIKKGGCNIDF